MFGNYADVGLAGDRTKNKELSAAMSRAWAAFARNGDPNHAGMPKCESYNLTNYATVIFDVRCKLAFDPGSEELDAWAGSPLH